MKFARQLWLDFLASFKAYLFPQSRRQRRRSGTGYAKPWRPRLGAFRSLAFQHLEPKQLLTTFTVAETANANAITGTHGQFTLTASLAPTQMTTVNLNISGSAVASQENTALMNSVMFSPGQSTETIDVSPISNGSQGTSPTVIVTLTSAMGATIGSPSSATDTITEPSSAPTVTSLSPNAGTTAGGTSVIITGTGFNSISGVTFGGAPATNYTVNSSSQLTATSPSHAAGSVDLVVSTMTNGMSATGGQDQFAFQAAPIVSGVSPGAGPTSGGGTITISGNNFYGVTGVSIGGTAATSYTVTTSSSISAVLPAEAAGVANVTVTTSAGTSATGGQDQFTFQAAPIVSGVSPASGPTTGGTTITIAGQNFLNVSAVDFGTGSQAVAATSYIVTSSGSINVVTPPGNVGVADVTVTSSGGTSATGSQDEFTYVPPAPNMQLLDGASALSNGGTDEFGATVANPVTKTFTVSNAAGTGPLTVNSLTLSAGFTTSTAFPLSIPAGGSSQFSVTMSATTAGEVNGQMALDDNDPANSPFTVSLDGQALYPISSVSIEAATGTATEQGGTNGQFQVMRTGGDMSQPLTVSISTSGSAVSGSDYAPIASTLTIPAGAASAPIDVVPIAGGGTQSVIVSIDPSPAYVVAGTGSALVWVVPPYTPPIVGGPTGSPSAGMQMVSIGAPRPTANEETGVAGQFMLFRAAGDPTTLAQAAFVELSIGGSAVLNEDYDLSGVALQSQTSAYAEIPAGQHTLVIDVSPIDDAAIGDPNKTVQLTIVPGTTQGSTVYAGPFPSATVTIDDSDPPDVSIVATQPNADEEAGSTGTLTVTRDGPTTAPLTVSYSVGGDVVNGTDLEALPGSLTIPAGAASATITVTPVDDGLVNPARQEIIMPAATGGTFTLTVGGATTALLAFNAGAADVQNALTALSTVGAGNAVVTGLGTPLVPFVVAFTGALLDADVPAITADGSQLTGTPTINVTMTAPGGAPEGGAQRMGIFGQRPPGTGLGDGQFIVIFDGNSTAPLSDSSSAGDVQNALGGLPGIGAGNVSVSQDFQGDQVSTFLVQFTGSLSGQNMAPLSVNTLPPAFDTPDSIWPTPTGIQQSLGGGSSGANAVQTVTITAATGGTFTLGFRGFTTSPIAWNASADAVAAALEELPSIRPGNVAVAGSPGGAWQVTFQNALGGQPVPMLAYDSSHLSNGPITVNALPLLSPQENAVFTLLPDPGVYDIATPAAATVVIADSDPHLSVSTVSTGGTGGTPLANGDSTVDFGGTQVAQPVGEEITLASDGNVPLTLDPSSLVLPAGFELVGSFPTTIAVGATSSFELELTAAAPGAYGGAVSFMTNDVDDAAPFRFNVTGEVTPAPTVTAVSPAFGPLAGGTSVTITGTDLTNVALVFFGATPASNFTLVSSNQIVATAPADLGPAGAVDVTVSTNDGGTSVTSPADQFTYLAAPAVSGVNPTSGPLDGGTTVTISGSGFDQITAVDFGTGSSARAASSFTVVSPTTIVAVTPPDDESPIETWTFTTTAYRPTNTVDVTVTGAGGTSSIVAADQFTYQAAPTVDGVSPGSGPLAGGTSITITGKDFANVTAVSVGGVPAASFTVVSTTEITALVPPETGPAGSGTVDVTVTNTGGASATNAGDQFTYQPAPTVSGVSPVSGPLAGGTWITIDGENFANVTAVDFGTGTAELAALSYEVLTSTEIAALTPAGSAGTVDVIVVNTGGISSASSSSGSAADEFTFQAAPTVSGVSPASGPTAGGTQVTITGENLLNVSAVSFGGVPAASFAVLSPTSIIATSPAPSISNATSTVDVTVTTIGGVSATSAVSGNNSDQFTYQAAPTVSGVSPASGPTAGGTAITITGQNFGNITAVDFGGTAAAAFTVQSATTIVAVAPASTGPAGSTTTVDVTVANTGGASPTSASDQFTYQAAPTVSAVSPAFGPLAGGTAVTITGEDFANITAVDFVGPGAGSGVVAAASFTVLSSTSIVAVAPAGSASTVDVTVTNTGGTSATVASDQFTFLDVPVVGGVAPGSGSTAGDQSITITGQDFVDVGAVDFGAAPATFTVLDADTIVAVSPAEAAATVDVTVTTPGGTSATGAADLFTFVDVPRVDGVSPASGPLAGGTEVTITGGDFTDVAAVDFGTGSGAVAASTFTVQSSTTIVAVAPPGTGPAGLASTVDVTVTNGAGTSATSTADQFTYQPAPSVSGVSPATGPTVGGTTVTITGQDFANITAVDFGTGSAAVAATSFIVQASTTIVAVAPAEATGIIDVTVTNTGGTSATNSADQFTYQDIPAVSGVSPASGPTAGGTTVTITGGNLGEATAVDFGAGSAAVAAASYTVVSATEIVAVPAAGTGTVDVTVTNANGTSAVNSADQFTFQAAPTITAVSPASGPLAGGTAVTITGANLDNLIAVDFGGVSAAFTRLSSTSIVATAPASTGPAGSAGTVDITVTNTGGTSATSSSDQFTYQAAPSVSAVSPASGPLAGGTAVTITGENFDNLIAVDFGGVSATFTRLSSNSIVATAPASTGPAGASSPVDITIANTGGTSAVVSADQFTYQAAPTVSGVSPGSGPLAGGTAITITGENFANVTAVSVGGVPAASFSVVSSTKINAVVPPSTGPAGSSTVDVTVTNTGGTSPAGASDQFTYQAAPSVSAVSPASGPTSGGTKITITGENFANVTALDLGGAAAASLNVVSSTEIVAITAAASAGVVDVTVTNTGGTSTAGTADQFTIQAAPTVSGVSPASGPTDGGTAVTITGENFANVIAVDFGTGPAAVAASSFTVQSSTTIVAVAPPGTGPAGSASTVDVTVTNTGGTSAASASDQFTYRPQPLVSAVSPASGPPAGGTSVTITGEDFDNLVAVDFGGVAAASFTRQSSTSIVAVVPPEAASAGTASTVDVTVTNTGGTSAIVSTDQFTYQPAPVVSGVSPASGSTFGGASITITGQYFDNISAVDFGTGSAAVAATFTVLSPNTIVAVAPAEATGTIDVTVTNTGGTSAISTSDQFTYVEIPQVNGVTPGSGPTAGGTLVAITGANLSAATAVLFGTVPASNFTILSSSMIVATSPAEAAPSGANLVVDVTVINANGTSASNPSDQFTFQPAPIVSAVSPASGSIVGGTQVTITGQDFDNVSGVYFGPIAAANVTVVSPTTLLATAPPFTLPPGATSATIDVTVTSTGGTSTTSTADQFAYQDIPAVTGISPASGLTAGGESITITGGNFTGAVAVDFGTGSAALAASSFTIVSPTTIVAVVPGVTLPVATSSTVDVTVANANGTSATNVVDQFTFSDVPVVNGVTPDFGPTAGGTTVTITGQNFVGATAVDFGTGVGAVPAVSFTVTSPTTIVAVAPVGTASAVDVTVTTAAGGISPVSTADQFTFVAVANGIHVANFGLVDDTGVSRTDLITYDPRVTGKIQGTFLASGDQAIIQFDDLDNGQVSGSTSAITVAGMTFNYDPSVDDPALVGFAGAFTLHYRTVETDNHNNVISTGAWTPFTMTLYAATPTVSVMGLALLDDTDPTSLTLATSDPRVTGSVMAAGMGALPASGATIEFSHHGNGAVDGTVAVTQTNPMFTYDPRVTEPALSTFVGMLDLEYRTLQYDAAGYAIHGAWTSFPFTLEQAVSLATIDNLGLKNVTGAAGPPPVTSDPTVTGVAEQASGGGNAPVDSATVQFEYNADTVPHASTSAGPDGSFSYSLPNLTYGVVTVHARAVQLSMQGGFEEYGAWSALTFDYEPPPAPTITGLALAIDTGAPANPGHTTNPTVTGTITGAAVGQAVDVEFDTNNDGVADAQIAATGNTFTFTPTGLDPGPITIQARSVVHQPNSTQLSFSPWTSLTFTYLATPSAPPTIQGLQLASLAGTTTVATSDPVTADPTLMGVAEFVRIPTDGTLASPATGADFQTVQFDTNGDGNVDASTTTDAQGNFTFTPTGLAAGPVTIGVRAKVWDMASNADLYSSWSTISFTYQPAAANSVVVSQFALLDNTGTAAAPQATDPTVTGVAEYASIQGSGGQASGGGNAPVDSTASSATAYATIQFDTNGDGNPDASVVADANGAFQFTPTGLPFGNVTIAARAVTHDTAAGGFTYGAWTPLTFDYLQTVVPAPTIDSFTLVSVTDSPTSGGAPVTANATVKGHVNYQGDPTQLVIEITDPNEASALGAGIDAAGYTTVIPDAQGNFIFTPQYLSLGAATIEARIQSYFDPATQAIVTGAWTSLSFTYETQPRRAPVITSLGLLDSTGAVTSGDLQPAIGGTVSYQGDLAGITLQYSLDGGETTAGTSSSGPLTTDAFGNFNFSPAGLAAGNVTIDVRTQVFDDVGNQLLVGAWTPFTFTYQPPAAPSLAIGAFALASSSTDSQGNLTASDPTVTGVAEFVRIPTDGTSIQGAGASSATPVANVTVQFDTNGDGTPDGGTTTDASGNFTYTPTGLAAGAVTIAARVEDTAADGTSVFSPWTSLSFTYVRAGTGAPVISQLVLSDDNGASSTDLSTSDPTVAGLATIQGSASPAAPAVGVVIEFDTNGDGTVDGSVTTNSHGQFTYTPYVAYGVNTIGASIAGTAPDGSSTLGPWTTLSFEYAADPDGAAAQAAAAALAANGTSGAQSAHDAAVASAGAQSQSALDTASGNYRSATNGAAATGEAATAAATAAAATAAYSSQTATANATYDASVASAGQAFTTAMHSFSADPTSYSTPKFTWPAAPADPAGPTDSQPSPPIQAPTYSGPAFDVTADPGYQAAVATAQATYDGSVEGATTTYDGAVEQAKTTYDAAVQSAQQTRYQVLETAEEAYQGAIAAPDPTGLLAAKALYTQESTQTWNTLLAALAEHYKAYRAALSAAPPPYSAAAPVAYDAAQRTLMDANLDSSLAEALALNAEYEPYAQAQAAAAAWSAENAAQASGALDVASADADKTYKEALAGAALDQSNAVAEAAKERNYANIDAEMALTQAVADAASTVTAAWAAADGTPWAQDQSDLAANEAQYVNDDATANATLRKAEADADLAKARAIAQATNDEETAQAAAVAQSAGADANALVTLAVDDAEANLTFDQNGIPENKQDVDNSLQVQHAAALAIDAAVQVEFDAEAAAASLQGADKAAALQAAQDAFQNSYVAINTPLRLSQAQMAHDSLGQVRAGQLILAGADSANNLTAEQALAQAQHDQNIATATALADFDKANANADYTQIVAVAQADQAFGDAEAALQGTLDLANADSSQSFHETVGNTYVSQMQAWAQTQGTPWATLQAALAADDAQWTTSMVQANVDEVQGMQAPNLAWAVANDAAEETQTIDDAAAQAAAAAAGADATLAAATTVADAQRTQQNDNALAAQVLDQATNTQTETEYSAVDDQNLAFIQALAQAGSAADASAAKGAWALALAGERSLVAGEQAQAQTEFGEAVTAHAVTLSHAVSDADVQQADDQAAAAQTLAVAQADDAQAVAVAGAQADQTLADAQASADQTQQNVKAAAQAQLDLSTSDDSQQYSVAQATDDAAALAAVAATDGTPLATYQAALAATDATQAAASATAAHVYETAVTVADVTQSDSDAAAQYALATTQNAQDLSAATQTAGFQQTQAVDDAGFTYDEATAVAAAGGVWLNAVATAYANFYDQSTQAGEAFIQAAYTAGTTTVEAMAQAPAQSYSALGAVLDTAQAAEAASIQTASITDVSTQADSNVAEAQALDDAGAALTSAVSQAKVALAQGLADDANTEAAGEQAATAQEAQALDAATVTESTGIAQAEVDWTTTTTSAATAQTAANGLASVAAATSAANAQAVYHASVAAAAATSADAWANAAGSPAAKFAAAAADAWSAWITATSPDFVTDQTADAQAQATYANATAAIDATQQQQAAGEDLTLATTVAQAAQTEHDQQAAADQTYAIATTADQGIHDVANAEADQTVVAAEAEANRQFDLSATQALALEFQMVASASVAATGPIFNWYTLTIAAATATEGDSRQDATLAWTKSTAQNDATLEIDQAAATQTHDTDVADATHTYAYAAANAQWTHDENVAAEAQSASIAADAAAVTQAQTSNAADTAFAVSQYDSAATVTAALAATIRTPWVNYQAALATAEAAWAVANAPSEVNYQNTLAADQQTASDALAAAALTEANSSADAARVLAKAQADADQTQSVADAAAAYAQQQADANTTEDYLVGVAQGAHDFNVAENGFVVEVYSGVSTWAQSDAAEAAYFAAYLQTRQQYLAGEADANATLTAANDSDQQSYFASVQQAQLTATMAGDAASEAYQASLAQATDTQQQNDVLADQSFQTAGSATYSSAMAALPQANPSPWADQHAAQAAAQATLTATLAHDSALEQIALSGAGEAESIANALAGQALADAQALAATDLAIAQAAADSTLDTALAAAAAALAPFAPNAADSLPPLAAPPMPVVGPLAGLAHLGVWYAPYDQFGVVPEWGPTSMNLAAVDAAFGPISEEPWVGMSTWWSTPIIPMGAYGINPVYSVDVDLALNLRAFSSVFEFPSTPQEPRPWWLTPIVSAANIAGNYAWGFSPFWAVGQFYNYSLLAGYGDGYEDGAWDPYGYGYTDGYGYGFGYGYGYWSPYAYGYEYGAGYGGEYGFGYGWFGLPSGSPTYAELVGLTPVIGSVWDEYDLFTGGKPGFDTVDYVRESNGQFAPGPAPALSPPTPDDTANQLALAGTPLGTLSDDSQPTQDDAGGVTQIAKAAARGFAAGVNGGDPARDIERLAKIERITENLQKLAIQRLLGPNLADAVPYAKGLVSGFVDGFTDTVGGIWSIAKGLVWLGKKYDQYSATGLMRRFGSSAVTGADPLADYKADQNWMQDRITQLNGAADSIKQFGQDLVANGTGLLTAIVNKDQARLGAYGELAGEVAMYTGDLIINVVDDLLAKGTDPNTQGYITGRVLYEIAEALLTAGAAKAAKAGAVCKALQKLEGMFGGTGDLASIFAKAIADLRRLLAMCFVAGTPVHTQEGLRPIEQIRAGDMVLCRDESAAGDRSALVYRPVRETVVTRPTTLYHLTIDAADGSIETLGTTAEHPFFVPSRGDFIRAGDLREGDDLLQADGSVARLVAIRIERAEAGQSFTTFNFEVAEFHTYHVGRSGVWVHNAGFFNCDAALDVFQKGGVDALADYIRKGNFDNVDDALKQLGKSLDADDLAKLRSKLDDGLNVVPRPGMTSRTVTAANGRTLTVWGQAEAASSTTPGHADAIDNLVNRLAATGEYEYVTIQRSWRTATGRVGESRSIPDVIGVRRNGMVDAWEVQSATDNAQALRLRLSEGMNTLPRERRGEIYVIPPQPPGP